MSSSWRRAAPHGVLPGAGPRFGRTIWSFILAVAVSSIAASSPGTARAEGSPQAERAVLYEEDLLDPNGKRFDGYVTWRTEPSTSADRPADAILRADVEIPERHMKLTLRMRRNADATLPASHTLELSFTTPADFAGGGIASVPGMLMKSDALTKGVPLRARVVKVTSGMFLVGLSSVEADRTLNVQIMQNKNWLDIPIVYANQRRAILAIEKGETGTRAFDDAFAIWHE